MCYQAKLTPISKVLSQVWGIEVNFKEHYWRDYNIIKGDEEQKSSWCDKYTTVIFHLGEDWVGEPTPRIHLQPLPDFIRWQTSGGELHYPTKFGVYLPVVPGTQFQEPICQVIVWTWRMSLYASLKEGS